MSRDLRPDMVRSLHGTGISVCISLSSTLNPFRAVVNYRLANRLVWPALVNIMNVKVPIRETSCKSTLHKTRKNGRYRQASKAMVLCTMGMALMGLGSTIGLGSTMGWGPPWGWGLPWEWGPPWVWSHHGYGVHHGYGDNHYYGVHLG